MVYFLGGAPCLDRKMWMEEYYNISMFGIHISYTIQPNLFLYLFYQIFFAQTLNSLAPLKRLKPL